MEEFGVLVEIAVIPGKLGQLQKAFDEFYKLTLEEPGLKFGKVMADKDDPEKVYVFEIWETQKDFEKHLTTAHCQKFSADIEGTYGPEGYIRYLEHFI